MRRFKSAMQGQGGESYGDGNVKIVVEDEPTETDGKELEDRDEGGKGEDLLQGQMTPSSGKSGKMGKDEIRE